MKDHKKRSIFWKLLHWYEKRIFISMMIGFFGVFFTSFLYDTLIFTYFIVPVFGGIFVLGILFVLVRWLFLTLPTGKEFFTLDY